VEIGDHGVKIGQVEHKACEDLRRRSVRRSVGGGVLRQLADFRAVWPGRPIIKLPNAGHFSQEDEPDTIIALIQQFIQST
jgi:pimeloyl-ACP methyl ester carboxylesterase